MLILAYIVCNLKHYLRVLACIELIHVNEPEQDELLKIGHLDLQCSLIQAVPRVDPGKDLGRLLMLLRGKRGRWVIIENYKAF